MPHRFPRIGNIFVATKMARAFFIDPHLHAFIVNADFGELLQPVGDACVPAGRLQDSIPTVVRDGIATGRLLSNLLLSYINHHRLRDPKSKRFWYPDEAIQGYLGPGLDFMRERSLEDARLGNVAGDALFNPEKLTIGDIPRIVDAYRVRDEDLSQVEVLLLDDPQLQADLNVETTIVQLYLQCIWI